MKRFDSEEKEPIKVPQFHLRNGYSTNSLRSKVMSKIKGKNTQIEVLFRKALWKAGLRFRVHSKYIPGRPDISIQKYRLVIFVDGDFWHGYKWNERKKPKVNEAFWALKIERNIQRDQFINELLTMKGYTVMRFWEHEINKELQRCVNQVLLYIEAVKSTTIPDIL